MYEDQLTPQELQELPSLQEVRNVFTAIARKVHPHTYWGIKHETGELDKEAPDFITYTESTKVKGIRCLKIQFIAARNQQRLDALVALALQEVGTLPAKAVHVYSYCWQRKTTEGLLFPQVKNNRIKIFYRSSK